MREKGGMERTKKNIVGKNRIFCKNNQRKNLPFLCNCDMDNWVIYWGISDSIMDLVQVVTSCCNRYYFEYGWHFHYPEFELLSKCEIYRDDELSSEFIIPVCSRNMNVIREKLGLYNKEP